MNILLICGGKSGEHEISLQSAQFVIKYAQHDISLLLLEKNGGCILQDKVGNIISKSESHLPQIIKSNNSGFICKVGNEQCDFDVAFPMLHGPYGEDGTIQGWLQLLEVPYTGCGIIASAISMDKDIAKRLVKGLGINTINHITLTKSEWNKTHSINTIINYPVFVKTANSGSSIGVYKVKNQDELFTTLEKAFEYDNKVLIEGAIEKAREIEVAIIEHDNHDLTIGTPGELIIDYDKHEFFSHQAKYFKPEGTKFIVPPSLTVTQVQYLQKIAKVIFQSLNCMGMARIDFLLQGEEFFFSEINTIPGFTELSHYPVMLKAAKIEYPQLIDILLNTALSQKK